MSELSDRRAAKKARTRELVRSTAHRLFAERGFDAMTIADVARDADVAVQTVFNHFATKEELFFDGRTPWVAGSAEAVRTRTPGTSPLTALRDHLLALVAGQLGSLACAERRSYVATVEASETLRARERELAAEAERRLAAALLEAWRDEEAAGRPMAFPPEVTAPLVAAMWLSAVRVLIVENRGRVVTGETDAATVSAAVEHVADRVLGHLHDEAHRLHGRALPAASGRRAG
ncbi:TetR/AcrR family transcriptional regulator [Blastococcus sp. TF02A-30]|uniref:TetR/AcrR family transcriptional regulator n=1 Tax=Blastococcus sp. TF02A-30 TaxID=2250580 RepID=UPI0013142D84|nr:TetR/AcrR family transcriptional regulator [Blastococcus sp. TF02A-30]